MRTVKITLLIGVIYIHIYIYNPMYNDRLVYHLGAPFGNALPSAWIPLQFQAAVVEMQTIPAPANSLVRTLDSMFSADVCEKSFKKKHVFRQRQQQTKKLECFFKQLNMKDNY